MKNAEQDFTLPPFPGFPSTNRFVAIGPVLETVSRVARSVSAREAISLVIGPPGTGKSLVCSLLGKQFAGSHRVLMLGETGISDEAALHRVLLRRMGVALNDESIQDLESLLIDSLMAETQLGTWLIIIDEAAALSIEVLEAVRRITNLMRDGQPIVSAVIAGNAKLDETLTAPSLESFVQRVAARCYLHPLNFDETRQYIRESIAACDASPDDTIAESAISAIHHAAGGIPRLINQLMTEAIDCAAELGESLIADHTVDKAWASLQQLPSPIVDEPKVERVSSSIEFGELCEISPTDETKPAAETEVPSQLFAESISRDQTEEDSSASSKEAVTIPLSVEEETPIADPAKLFGDFDEEEELKVVAVDAPASANMQSELDLESMLHSEIVSLSHFAAENTDADVIKHAEKENPQTESSEQDAVIEMIESDFENQTAMEEALGTAGAAAGIVWYEEPNSSDASLPMETSADGRDDSDLLWVTEDIDVENRTSDTTSEKSHRVDPAAKSDELRLKVDYREMLAKMRSEA